MQAKCREETASAVAAAQRQAEAKTNELQVSVCRTEGEGARPKQRLTHSVCLVLCRWQTQLTALQDQLAQAQAAHFELQQSVAAAAGAAATCDAGTCTAEDGDGGALQEPAAVAEGVTEDATEAVAEAEWEPPELLIDALFDAIVGATCDAVHTQALAVSLLEVVCHLGHVY